MNAHALFSIGLAAALIVPAVQVFSSEQILASGEELMLALAPRDPRSLVQGDYMALAWAMERDLSAEEPPTSAHAIVWVDDDHLATFLRYDDGQPLAESERRIDVTWRDGTVDIAPDAWFFQEGEAERFEPARYGVLSVAPDGRVLLVGLADEAFVRLDGPADPEQPD